MLLKKNVGNLVQTVLEWYSNLRKKEKIVYEMLAL
jgi:hypothetical protein